MTDSSEAKKAYEERYAKMRQNAGDWLLKNRNALFVCQSVLLQKFYQTYEELAENENHDPNLCCFLQEIEDVVDLIGSTVAELRNQNFWPQPLPNVAETENKTS